MIFLQRTLRFFNLHFLKLSWFALGWVLVAHFSLSMLLMYGMGERELLADWFYFYITTATTIGYGDLSPSSYGGRILASIVIMPGAVVLFAGFLGKISSFFIDIWRMGMQGKEDYSSFNNHVVILGWHRRDTARMIDLIFGDARREDRAVVLCTAEDIENPFPEKVHFVRGESLKSEDLLRRAGVNHAARIIVFRDSDDETLATCLTLSATETKAHIVAWFNEESMARLLKKHCPEIECHSSISVDLLVRSAQDPGSYRLQGQLLSTLVGPTQYSIRIPDHFDGVSFGRVLDYFKVQHEAMVLGVADSLTGDDLQLNPASHVQITAGQLLYYMAAQRIRSEDVGWSELESH
ncbi:hypothetical protein ACH42_04935 [Endozoicomonas sp. (ex Bugula neritina AB1)]|nr:hypothetical protein ACH42_04935 [Endozoicomonas sp. (ex Bugula neritina AB1)]